MSDLRRTRLYVPGNSPALMENCMLYGADCIILDLEDSVSVESKMDARILVTNAIKTLDFKGAEVMVRINGMDTIYWKRDLFTICKPGLTILLPKAETADQLKTLDVAIAEIEGKKSVNMGTTKIIALIETPLGVVNSHEIAKASKRIVALGFGAEDYTASLGVSRTAEGNETLFAKSQVVAAAKAAGVMALDTVYSDIENSEGLRRDTVASKGLGFDGRGVIHPNQVKIIHKVYTPSLEEVERARNIMKAIRDAEKHGSGVVALNGKMIDKPVRIRAEKTIAMARAAGLEVEE